MRKLRLTLLYSDLMDAQVMTKLFIHAPEWRVQTRGKPFP